MSLEVLKSKETEQKLKDKFESNGYNWEKVKSDLEKVNKLEDIDGHLNELSNKTGDYINNYYLYLKWLIDKHGNVDNKNIKTEKEEEIKNIFVKKIKSIPVIWWLLEKVFLWVENSKSNENDSWWDKIIKPIFASIWAWILWYFWWDSFEKYRKWMIDLEEMLDNNQINNVKETIISELSKKIPWKEDEIKKILNNGEIFSYDKIIKYHKQIESWKWIPTSMLIEDFWNIWNLKEILNVELADIDKKTFDSISKFIKEKYWTDLDEDKQNSLRTLIKKYITNNDLSSEKLKEILKDWFKISDLYPILWDSMMFTLELVAKWIIDIMDLWLDFVSSWGDIVNISLNSLWFSGNISTDSFIEKINNLNPDEKALFIWVLYRKWWLFLNIMWNITAWTTRLLLDTTLPANTWVDWLKLFKDWILEWPEKQIRNLAKIEAAIRNTKVTEWLEDYIKMAKNNLRDIRYNTYLIKLLSESNNDIKVFESKVNNLNNSSLKNYIESVIPKNVTNFNDFKNQIWNKISKEFHTNTYKFSIDKSYLAKEKIVWFWSDSALQKFNRWLSNIATNQVNILKWSLELSAYRKIIDSIDTAKISNLWDKLLFELRSKKDAKAFIKQLNSLAQSSPELIKWIFNKLPIISVVWLSASSDKPFFEELQKEMLYLIPLVWPILIFWEWGFKWNNGSIEIENPENIILGWALIWLDVVVLWKDILSWNLWKAWKYMIKPLSDIIDIWKWSVEFIQKITKTARTAKWFSGLFKEAFEKTKNIRDIKKRSLVIILLIGWSIAYATSSESWLDEYKDKNWELDIDKFKKSIANITEDEKLEFIKTLFPDEVNNNMSFKLNWNILDITSNTNDVKWDWFIDDETREKLSKFLWITEINFS